MTSEHLRLSSPLSSSPGRAPAFSRPAWPWSRYSHSRPSSVHSNSTSVSGQRASGSWEAGNRLAASVSLPSTQRGSSMRVVSGLNVGSSAESHRQWSFTGFEWVIRDVMQLKNWVETPESAQTPDDGEAVLTDDSFEILKESPSIGDDKFKLEIARTIGEGDSERNGPQTLSLYITSMIMDFAQADYEIPTSIMAAVKCQDDRSGERGSRPDWVWQVWQQDWSFRQENEVWACPLPPLSELLDNTRIRETNSLVICIQIHSPVGPFFPQHPTAYYVPRDLLDGLEASLDNANTGDIRFVCLEKMHPELSTSPAVSEDPDPGLAYAHHTTARKRYIYAHSDILIRRSEYFATMLRSSFLEAQSSAPGERKLYTIVVDEADFETVYWLLKYCYANWVLFKEHDDPRAAVEGIGAGWNAKWLHLRGDEWDWKTFSKTSDNEDSVMGDSRSITSGGSRRSNDEAGSKQIKTLHPPMPTPGSSSRDSSSASARAVPPAPKPVANSARQPTTPSTSAPTPRRPSNSTSTTSPAGLGISSSSSLSRSKTVPIPISASNPSFATPSHYPISPRSQRNHSTPDPHLHPAPTPPPASALSIYQIAHRYSLPSLASLALEHMMSTITPQSGFALLLATSIWDDLHNLVEDYVVEKWDEVSVSEEFEKCCDEVAAGEWGPEGGKTMMALFRRLRSPNAFSAAS